jgi:excinuclease ABC subunit B
MGRAARNVNALVVMYADKMTPAMQAAIGETERRRAKQLAYNTEHGITPTTIQKAIRDGFETELKARRTARQAVKETEQEFEVAELVREMEAEMLAAAEEMEFEKAAKLRDAVKKLKARGSDGGGKVKRSEVEGDGTTRRGGGGGPEKKAGMPGVRANKRSRKAGRGE